MDSSNSSSLRRESRRPAAGVAAESSNSTSASVSISGVSADSPGKLHGQPLAQGDNDHHAEGPGDPARGLRAVTDAGKAEKEGKSVQAGSAACAGPTWTSPFPGHAAGANSDSLLPEASNEHTPGDNGEEPRKRDGHRQTETEPKTSRYASNNRSECGINLQTFEAQAIQDMVKSKLSLQRSTAGPAPTQQRYTCSQSSVSEDSTAPRPHAIRLDQQRQDESQRPFHLAPGASMSATGGKDDFPSKESPEVEDDWIRNPDGDNIPDKCNREKGGQDHGRCPTLSISSNTHDPSHTQPSSGREFELSCNLLVRPHQLASPTRTGTDTTWSYSVPPSTATQPLHYGGLGSFPQRLDTRAALFSQTSGWCQSPSTLSSPEDPDSLGLRMLSRQLDALGCRTLGSGDPVPRACSTAAKPVLHGQSLAHTYRLVPSWQSHLIVKDGTSEFSVKHIPHHPRSGDALASGQGSGPSTPSPPNAGVPGSGQELQSVSGRDLVDGLTIDVTLPDGSSVSVPPKEPNAEKCIMVYTFKRVGRYSISVKFRGFHLKIHKQTRSLHTAACHLGSPRIIHSCVKTSLAADGRCMIVSLDQLPANRKLSGICLDPFTERLLLPDRNNHSVYSYHLATNSVQNPPIFPLGSNGQAALTQPTDVSVSPDGLLFVCDKAGHRLQVLDRAGQVLHTHRGLNTTWGVSTSADGRVAAASFSDKNGDLHLRDLDAGTVAIKSLPSTNPRKPLFLPSGGLLLADFERMALLEVFLDGIETTAQTQRFYLQQWGKPSGATVDPSGDVILSMGRSCILLLFRVAGGGTGVYYTDPVVRNFKESMVPGTSFGGVAVDSVGNIVVVLEDCHKTGTPPHRLLVVFPDKEKPRGRPLLGRRM